MSFLKDKSAKGATDILKVLALLGLPFVHASIILVANGFCTEGVTNMAGFFGFLMVFGGPVFMICLGIDLYENRSYKSIIKMGVEISLINIVFNLIRYNLPDSILVFAGFVPSNMMLIDPVAGDIYAFVGLFCIFYGLAKKFNWSLSACTAAAVGLFALNLLLENHLLPVDMVLGYYIGNLISGYDGACFSLFGWSIFPIIGLHIAKVMKLEKAKRDRTFGLILLGTVVAFGVFLAVLNSMGTDVLQVMLAFTTHVYGPLQAITMILSGVFAVSLMYFIYCLVPENRFERKVIMLTNLVMPFYLIHFVIVCWLICFPEFALLAAGRAPICVSVAGFFALSLGVTLVSAFICYKKGFTITRWLFKVFDYKRWFKKKKKVTA